MSEQSTSAKLPSHSCDPTDTRPIHGTIFFSSSFSLSLSPLLFFQHSQQNARALGQYTIYRRLDYKLTMRHGLVIDIMPYILRF